MRGGIKPLCILAVCVLSALAIGPASGSAQARLPAAVTTVTGHMYQPTDAALLPDGQMLVLEKQGILKLYPSGTDQLPKRLLDLTDEVWSYRDFGAMALALSPTFVTDRTLYVLYDRDALPGPDSTAPHWGTPGTFEDVCANPDAGCPVTGRLVSMKLTPQNTIEDLHTVLGDTADFGWCFQYDGHGTGDLMFDAAGALLVSIGDGSRSDAGDTGVGDGSSGCTSLGADETATEGGALRARDALTPSRYTSLNGTILRVDATTGAAWPSNVLVGGPTASDDRIVAMGLRNPFRMSLDAKTATIYTGDVGANLAEEIDALDTRLFASSVQDFEWPCMEGTRPSQFVKIDSSPLCSSTSAIPTSIGLAALTYGDLPAKWCSGEHLAVIGGDVFTRADGSQWYVFADWVRACMLAVPIAADRTLDISRAVRMSPIVAPARIRNIDGKVMLVDVGINTVRIYEEPFLSETSTESVIGQWIGRSIVIAISLGLLAVFLVRRRAQRRVHRRLEALMVRETHADDLEHDSLAGIS